MAVCLDSQRVFQYRKTVVISLRTQLLIAAVLLLALSFKIWVKLETTSLGYELGQSRQLALELSEEIQELELQLSVLTRPDHLARTARSKLGLLSHHPQRTILINGGGR